MKKIALALSAAALVLSLSACVPTTDPWADTLVKSGFTDVTRVDKTTYGETMVYVATAGSCQLRFLAKFPESRLYATVPGSSSVESGEFVGDPSLALLKQDERFAHCFEDTTPGSPAQEPR